VRLRERDYLVRSTGGHFYLHGFSKDGAPQWGVRAGAIRWEGESIARMICATVLLIEGWGPDSRGGVERR
jgi:hypothetical protein